MKAKGIVIFCIMCALLTGCTAPAQKNDEKASENLAVSGEKAEEASEKPSREFNWLTRSCGYDWVCDDSENGKIAQYDYKGNLLKTYSCSEIVKGKGNIEILNISDRELLYYEDQETEKETMQMQIVSVPMTHKNGKEDFDIENQKKVSSPLKLDGDIDEVSLIASNDKYLLFDALKEEESRDSFVLIHRDDGKQNWFEDTDWDYTLGSVGDSKIVFIGGDGKKVSAYIFDFDKNKMIPITTINPFSVYTMGGDKFFYTAEWKIGERRKYDLHMYDCSTGKDSVLVKEETLRAALPGEADEEIDLIQDLAYQSGVVKIEVSDGTKTYILSCDTYKGTVTREKQGHLKSHKQYKLNQPLEDANERYDYANDHNIFLTVDDDTGNEYLDEYTLQGEFVRRIFTNFCDLSMEWYLQYVSNDEMFITVDEPETGKTSVYIVPLKSVGGNDLPVFSQMKKLEGTNEDGLDIWKADKTKIFASVVDLVRGIDYCREYDRKKGKWSDLKINHNLTELRPGSRANKTFSIGAENSKTSDYDCYSYDFASGRIQKMFDNVFASDYFVQMGDQVIQCFDSIKSFDCKTKKQKVLVNKKDFYDAVDKNLSRKDSELRLVSEVFSYKDKLYMIMDDDTIFSYELNSKDGVTYEKKLSQYMKKMEKTASLESDTNVVIGNKVYISFWRNKSKGDLAMEDAAISYDFETKKIEEYDANSPEMIYFKLNKDY